MMRRSSLALTISGLLFASAAQVMGFSLVGPEPPWQTAALGFDPPLPGTFAATAGPMNINEEYRWNVPEVHYGYSAEFLSFFGEKGVDSIESGIEVINSVGDLDQVDVADYPTESGRMNLRAAALGLSDLKSYAMSAVVQALGLADPTRYSFVLRSRWVVNNVTNYMVTKRNFDPITLEPSSFVNGTLYTYIIEDPVPPSNVAWANNFPVDPLERLFPRTLPVAGSDLYAIPEGFFWTQLTRDDVGGLKHLYRSSNFNTETALADVTGGAGAGAAGGAVGFPGGGGSFDFPAGTVGVGGGPFDFPFNQTNGVAGGQAQVGGAVGVGGAAGGAVQGGNFINPALKGGFSNIQLVRADYDSLVGIFFEPLTVRFTETVRTNNRARSQSLTRIITQPDIIFDARDLQAADSSTVPVSIVVQQAFNSSDALDGITGDDFGPGVVVPPFRISFNTVGPLFLNQQAEGSFFLTEGSLGNQSLLTWGAFDGTTNDPVVFPSGTSILDLEQQVR